MVMNTAEVGTAWRENNAMDAWLSDARSPEASTATHVLPALLP